MAFCPYCGSEIQLGVEACPICGKKISARLMKKMEAAPEGEWVRANMIPWNRIGKIAAIVLLLVVLTVGVIGAVVYFRESGLPDDQNPTGVTTHPLSTAPSQTTNPGSTSAGTIPGLETAPIVGNWRGVANLAEFFNEKLEEEYSFLAKYLKVEQLDVAVILQFGADGVMSYHLDQETYEIAVAGCKEVWTQGMTDYIRAQFGMTPEDYEDLTDMTVEQMVANLIEQLKAKDVEKATSASVRYHYQDGQIAMEENLGMFIVEVNQEQLKFLDYSGENESASMESVFKNVEFYRQGD